jgi:hypothetical protein
VEGFDVAIVVKSDGSVGVEVRRRRSTEMEEVPARQNAEIGKSWTCEHACGRAGVWADELENGLFLLGRHSSPLDRSHRRWPWLQDGLCSTSRSMGEITRL